MWCVVAYTGHAHSIFVFLFHTLYRCCLCKMWNTVRKMSCMKNRNGKKKMNTKWQLPIKYVYSNWNWLASAHFILFSICYCSFKHAFIQILHTQCQSVTMLRSYTCMAFYRLTVRNRHSQIPIYFTNSFTNVRLIFILYVNTNNGWFFFLSILAISMTKPTAMMTTTMVVSIAEDMPLFRSLFRLLFFG